MIELDYSKIELSLTSTHKKVSLNVKKCEPFFEFTLLFILRLVANVLLAYETS